MRVAGQRIRRIRLIQTDRYVVAVEIEMVIPADDPSEPSLEAETVQLLNEVRKHTEQGDLPWLFRHGKVYTAAGGAE